MQNLNNNFLGLRVKFLREDILKITQSEMAEKSELTQRDISQIEAGKKKFLPLELIQLLNREKIDLNALFDENIDFEKLLPNLPPIILPKQKIESNFNNTNVSQPNVIYANIMPKVVTVDRDDNELIILVQHKAAAGYLNGYADPEFVETLPSFTLPGFKGNSYRAFEVKGESMMPTHHSGSIAIGQAVESLNDIRDRRVYILLTKNEGIVIKRILNRIKQDGKLILVSDNLDKSRYENIVIDPEDVLELWYWRASIIRQSPEPGALFVKLNELEAKVTLHDHYLKSKGLIGDV